MKSDIILAGVGGQGILSIAAVIGYAAIESGKYMKQSEVHGMSQRGGDVQSHLRISDDPIYSDLVPYKGADLIVAIEPMEGLRYVPYLSDTGYLIANSTPYKNIPNYPEVEEILNEIRKLPNHIIIDADAIAKELGNPRGVNMVMAGAASLFIDLPFEMMEKGVEAIFSRKGKEIVEANLKTLRAGREFAEKNR